MNIKNFLTNQSPTASSEGITDKQSQSVIETVMEIHAEFNDEMNRLLIDSQTPKILEVKHPELIEKVNRLRKLGFNKIKDVKIIEDDEREIFLTQRINEAKSEVGEALSYFASKYPLYKFITQQSIERICEKYGLIYGEVSHYEGTVPDSEVDVMEAFSIDEFDMSHSVDSYSHWGRNLMKTVSLSEGLRLINETNDLPINDDISDRHYNLQRKKFIIAAPEKDFNTEGMEVKKHRLSVIPVPDPVVMQPVMYHEKEYFLIVTAWGTEASDPIVVNEKFN